MEEGRMEGRRRMRSGRGRGSEGGRKIWTKMGEPKSGNKIRYQIERLMYLLAKHIDQRT